jgi:hypothetical protein
MIASFIIISIIINKLINFIIYKVKISNKIIKKIN